MGQHLSYEESKKVVFKGLMLLGVITIIEVVLALLGKGHVIEGFHIHWMLLGLIMISLSLYKAYFIIFEFMHMRYEVKGLVMSVLLPTALLIWAIIAFLQEGGSWGARREQINEKDAEPVKPLVQPQGMTPVDQDTYHLEKM